MLRQWRRWRQEPRRALAQAAAIAPTVLICMCLVVFVVVVLLGSVINNLVMHSGVGAISVTPRVYALPTTTVPLPKTPTPTNPLDHGPHLGGIDTEFNKLLNGQQSTMMSTATTIAGQQVGLATWEASDTNDNHNRIREIDLSPGSIEWTNEQDAMPVITFFLPPDAQYLRTETTDVSSYGTVIHHVYMSHLLAQYLAPSMFYDDLGLVDPIPPGTFEWYCWSNHGYINGPYSGCEILTQAPVK